MSAEFEITRDKDGFLNCKYCPRIFLMNILFENHLASQHKKDKETKPDIHHIQQLQTKTDESSIQKNIQFEKCSLGNFSFVSQGDLKLNIRNELQKAAPYQGGEFKKNFNSEINHKRNQQNGKECNTTFNRKLTSFGQSGTLQSHIDIVHKKLTPYQCQECKKYFKLEQYLKLHINVVHKKLTKFKCQECNTSFIYRRTFQKHINTVHKKLTPHQCQECKKYFGYRRNLLKHINAVHKKLTRYQCEECKESFVYRETLQSHIAAVHNKLTQY